MAANPEQAKAHRDLSEKYGVPILIAENYRYNEEINHLRDLLRTKRAGEPLYIMLNSYVDFPQEMREDKFAARDWRQTRNREFKEDFCRNSIENGGKI